MERYLNATGRAEVAKLANKIKEHLTADPEVYANPSAYFDQVIEINLSTLEPYINGPFTIQTSPLLFRKMKEAAEKNGWP